MNERNETIDLIDGTKAQIEVGLLSYEKRNNILKSCTKTKMVGQSSESEMDIFSLQTETLKHTIKGARIDMITSEAGDMLFHKYFANSFGINTSGQGNSEKTSEQQ